MAFRLSINRFSARSLIFAIKTDIGDKFEWHENYKSTYKDNHDNCKDSLYHAWPSAPGAAFIRTARAGQPITIRISVTQANGPARLGEDGCKPWLPVLHFKIYLATPTTMTSQAQGHTEIEKYFDMSIIEIPFDDALHTIGDAIHGLETTAVLLRARLEMARQ